MNIKVYGKQQCPACDSLKNFLNEKNIIYNYFEIGKDISINDFSKNIGSLSVPVLIKNNTTKLIGFSPIKLKKILQV